MATEVQVCKSCITVGKWGFLPLAVLLFHIAVSVWLRCLKKFLQMPQRKYFSHCWTPRSFDNDWNIFSVFATDCAIATKSWRLQTWSLCVSAGSCTAHCFSLDFSIQTRAVHVTLMWGGWDFIIGSSTIQTAFFKPFHFLKLKQMASISTTIFMSPDLLLQLSTTVTELQHCPYPKLRTK